jgi:triphosphatase
MPPQAAPTEIELTLRLQPADVARLIEAPELQALRAGPARERQLVSTYFDTADLALKRARVVIRVRRIGRRFVQTVKTAPSDTDAAITRGEWERQLKGALPDLSGLADEPGLAAAFGDAGMALQPVFTTDFKRMTIPLRVGNSDVELAIDRGEIRVGGANEPFCEIELELKSGDIGDVYAAATRLIDAVPMAIQPLAKSERAHALLSGEGVKASRATRVRLQRRDSIGTAFQSIARACLRQLRQNAAAIRASDDPAAMHQFRVALRRLRSAFSAFGTTMPTEDRRRFGRGLRQIARYTDAARELDVFATEILPAVRKGVGDADGIAAVAEATRDARAQAWSRVRKLLDGPAFARVVLDLEGWLEGGGWRRAAGAQFEAPVRDFARDVLKRQHRKMLREGRNIAELPETELHDLRLRGKKQRYAGEFFRELFGGKAAKSYLAALGAVQDHLGALNDAATMRAMLERLQSRGRRNRAELDRGAAVVLGWCAARSAAQIDALPAIWERFESQRPFWK